MTVCVALKVQDCIVFAADSATSLSVSKDDGSQEVVNVYKNGVKVFNLHKDLPIVAMTCGAGNIGSQSISFLSKELRLLLSRKGSPTIIEKDNYTLKSVAEKAHKFFHEQFEAENLPNPNGVNFEFWIGGYGSADTIGEIWKISYRESQLHEPVCESVSDLTTYIGLAGQTQVIHRILAGYDPEMAEVLKNLGLPEDQIENLLKSLNQRFMNPLVHEAMPVIDAIQLAQFLVYTTKGYFKYLPYADIVGGETEIATVTKHEGFKWIKRKHYYSKDFNLGNTDHVC